jgi:hypothetical protein
MKTINKLWIKRLTEEEMSSEPENEPISYMDDFITHYDFVEFIESLGFNYKWIAFDTNDERKIYKEAYEWSENTISSTDNIERIFEIVIRFLNGEENSTKLISIYASCSVYRYSLIERSVKFNVTYSALIRPAIPNSPYMDYTVKDFVLNVIALMEKITPEQSDEESSKLLKAIEHQFKEIDQSKNQEAD